MPRKRREISTKTPLSTWIQSLKKDQGMTTKALASLCGVSVATIHSWANGGYPAESVHALKKLSNHFGKSLAAALCGEEDISQLDILEKSLVFDGYLKVKIERVIPKK